MLVGKTKNLTITYSNKKKHFFYVIKTTNKNFFLTIPLSLYMQLPRLKNKNRQFYALQCHDKKPNNNELQCMTLQRNDGNNLRES